MRRLYLRIPSGNKAKEDIDTKMESMGYRNIALRSESRNGAIRFFVKLMSSLLVAVRVRRGDVLLMQYPYKKYYAMVCRLPHRRGVRVITLVHDLGCCRRKKLTQRQEVRRLNNTNVLIVHNEAMRRFLTSIGYRRPMITLGIFDYRASSPASSPVRDDNQEWQVVYAGGLARRKNTFLYMLDGHMDGWHLSVYGKGLDEEAASQWKNITPMGFIKSDDFIRHSVGHFGLVWDGSSLDACDGEWGSYLLINNPHKTSFYLRAGKPVIMWSRAALTPFVLSNGVGIAVSSLRDIGKALAAITPAQYELMCRNALRLSRELQEGKYFSQAVASASSLA